MIIHSKKGFTLFICMKQAEGCLGDPIKIIHTNVYSAKAQ